jgi:electron transfer flavoprotein alpha subunit
MADAPVLIDAAKCVGCGKCVKGCGFGALLMKDAPGANKCGRIAEVDPAACKACYACVPACPFKAISEAKAEVYGTPDAESYRDIWVFAEQTGGVIAEVVFELLTKARELKVQRGDGCKVCAVLLGSGLPAGLDAALASYGADAIYKVDAPELAAYEANAYVDALSQLVVKHKPEVVLAGATAIGRAFFARVAVRVRPGLTADCTSLKIENTRNRDTGAMQMLLHQTRPAFGGNIMATIMTPNHRPQMATVRPKVFRKSVAGSGAASACTIAEALKLIAPMTEMAGKRPLADGVDIAAAEVLVAGGRGLKKAENFAQLQRLADLLGGEVAASRAAVDAGWVDLPRQVGQTGKTVAPRVYICFGISGAIQHLEGIRGADTIIAVNSDPDAPIFGVADLGIVGDALEIIPALIRELE